MKTRSREPQEIQGSSSKFESNTFDYISKRTTNKNVRVRAHACTCVRVPVRKHVYVYVPERVRMRMCTCACSAWCGVHYYF